jgi:hypothetical protein
MLSRIKLFHTRVSSPVEELRIHQTFPRRAQMHLRQKLVSFNETQNTLSVVVAEIKHLTPAWISDLDFPSSRHEEGGGTSRCIFHDDLSEKFN